VAAPVPSELPSYRGYRFPAEIIGHAVWLYFRFSLSLRDVEELLAERGVTWLQPWRSSGVRSARPGARPNTWSPTRPRSTR
jgi:hypothetical protein